MTDPEVGLTGRIHSVLGDCVQERAARILLERMRRGNGCEAGQSQGHRVIATDLPRQLWTMQATGQMLEISLVFGRRPASGLTNAMIFVFPSDLEGCPWRLIDAMGAGLCVPQHAMLRRRSSEAVADRDSPFGGGWRGRL